MQIELIRRKMEQITKNIDETIQRIDQKCQEIGKHFADINLVVASKYGDKETLAFINQDNRLKIFGENRVQALLEKYDDNLIYDFIGQLQTNKVKYIIDKVRLIQSVDRLNLAEEIDRQAKKYGKTQEILLEVNSGREEEKGGVFPEKLLSLYDEVKNLQNLVIRGIMVVAPLNVEEKILRSCFAECRELYNTIKANDDNIKYLSMGMTNDFEIALEEGSNLLRLGRVIFMDNTK